MQCEICGNFFASTGGDTYNGKFICDNCQLIIKALGGEVGDMLKSTYDTDDSGVVDDTEGIKGKDVDETNRVNDTIIVFKTASDKYEHEAKPAGGGDMTKAVYDTDGDGVVDDSEKLESSTKAQVQDHTPKAHTLASHSSKAHSELTGVGANDHHNEVHTHTESDITDLDHDDVDAIHDNVAAEINAIAEKGVPVDADLLLIEDSAASNAKKKVQIGNLPSGGGGATFTVSGAQVYSGNSPTSWTDLDLSGTIGSNSAMVILAFRGNIDINALAVRKNGDTNEYYGASCEANAYGCALGHHDSDADLVLICVTDTSGVIEWKAESAVVCTVDVIAYIK
jgi:hypothetical protein